MSYTTFAKGPRAQHYSHEKAAEHGWADDERTLRDWLEAYAALGGESAVIDLGKVSLDLERYKVCGPSLEWGESAI